MHKLLSFILLMAITVHCSYSQISADSVKSLFNQYKFDEVIKVSENINFEDSLSRQVAYYRAQAFSRLSKYEQSIEILDKLIDTSSTDNKLFIDIAENYKKLENYSRSNDFYRKALAYDSLNSYLSIQLANNLFSLQKYREAIDCYHPLFTEDTTNSIIARKIAMSYEKLNNKDSAICYYHKALFNNPSDYKSCLKLGNYYKNKNDYKKALVIIDDFYETDSSRIEIASFNAYMNYLTGRFNIATDRFEYAIGISDSSQFNTKFLGLSYYEDSKIPKALELLKFARKKDTTDIKVCYHIGLSYTFTEHADSAIKYFDKTLVMLKPPPDFVAQIYQDLGYAYNANEQAEKALSLFFEAKDMTPENLIHDVLIANQYDIIMEDSEQASKYYKRFLSSLPDSLPPSLDNLVLIQYKQYALDRMEELKKLLFWEGKHIDSIK